MGEGEAPQSDATTVRLRSTAWRGHGRATLGFSWHRGGMARTGPEGQGLCNAKSLGARGRAMGARPEHRHIEREENEE